MKNSLRALFLLTVITLVLFLQQETKANVFAHHLRVTNPGSNLPFDGRFDDGSGAAIRFILSDRADSIWINIYSGNTLVRTITDTGYTNVDTFIVWDGKNNSGQYVPTGNYTYSVKVWNSGYANYTTIHYSTPAIFTRGVTAVTNPSLKNFGFIYTASNGGYVTGVARHANNGTEYGDVPGAALLTTTGTPVGPSELRYSSEADQDGYIYLIGRTNREIYRYHTDSLNVYMIDSGGYKTNIQGLAIYGTGVNKYIVVVGDTSIYGLPIGNNHTYFGQKDLLVSTNGAGITMYDAVVTKRDSVSLWVTFYGSPDGSTKPGLAKFDFTNYNGVPKTFLDTVWTVRLDTGRASTCAISYGATAADDIIYLTQARIASGNPPSQAIWAIKGINGSTPTKEVAYQDLQNNITAIRADVTVDAAGNLIFFENSNEEVVIISPPNTGNSFTTNALSPIQVILAESISAVRIDANGDFIADRLNEIVTVIGIVNSVNWTASSNRFQYAIQDATGGIVITKGSEPGGGPVYKYGDRLLVTGKVTQFNGTVQLELTNLATDIQKLDSLNTLVPVELSVTKYIQNAEKYESMLIKIPGLAKTPTNTVNWPASGSDANINIWDGYTSAVLRIDRDTDIDGTTEPTFPISVIGTATQFTTANPPNVGYQITPNKFADITGGVAVPPHPYFALVSPANNTIITISDSSLPLMATWRKTVDLNNDPILYQFMLLKTPLATSPALSDTFYKFTGATVLGWMGANDTLVTKWTVRSKGNETTFITSVDTFNITFIKNITGIRKESGVPVKFFVDQNYPNPFNPATTIRFGLPSEAMVDLRVYNILGQEVAVLVNGENYKAGNYSVNFDASRLATGTYIYRIQAGNFVETKKMILVK